MKAFKFILFLIIAGLLGLLGYQNQEYFLAATALHLDLNVSSLQYTIQALPNWAYWGLCFGLGLLITGMRGLFTAFRLGREIKTKDTTIQALRAEINTLRTDLEVFTHDPYIKNKMAAATAAPADTTEEKPQEPAAEGEPQS